MHIYHKLRTKLEKKTYGQIANTEYVLTETEPSLEKLHPVTDSIQYCMLSGQLSLASLWVYAVRESTSHWGLWLRFSSWFSRKKWQSYLKTGQCQKKTVKNVTCGLNDRTMTWKCHGCLSTLYRVDAMYLSRFFFSMKSSEKVQVDFGYSCILLRPKTMQRFLSINIEPTLIRQTCLQKDFKIVSHKLNKLSTFLCWVIGWLNTTPGKERDLEKMWTAE